MHRSDLRGAATATLSTLAVPSLGQGISPVKIGVLSDLSGFVADISGAGFELAPRMAICQFGEAILGKPIKLVCVDHKNKPDIGALLVRNRLDVEHVDSVADVPTFSVGLAVQEVTQPLHALVE